MDKSGISNFGKQMIVDGYGSLGICCPAYECCKISKGSKGVDDATLSNLVSLTIMLAINVC